jgi:1,4-dihydroxy-2-naphthoyl-CoA hydrolase
MDDDDALRRAHPDLSLGALDRKMGIRVLEASPDRVVATMPVETNTQSFGLLHGGAMASLAEAVGSWAAVIHAGPGRTVVGVDLNATHHRGAREGVVTATAEPLHRGSTVATYEVTVRDEQDRRLCTARMTSLILAPRPAG